MDTATLDLLDGDAYLAALKRPALKLEGRVFVGRVLSFEEWAVFAERFTPAGAGVRGNDVHDVRRFRALVRDVITVGYGAGRPWWAFWQPTIAQRMARQPMSLQVEFLNSFSRSQADAFSASAVALTPKPGTPLAS